MATQRMKKIQLALICGAVVVSLGYVLQFRATTASSSPSIDAKCLKIAPLESPTCAARLRVLKAAMPLVAMICSAASVSSTCRSKDVRRSSPTRKRVSAYSLTCKC